MKKYDSFEDDDYDYKKPSLLDKIREDRSRMGEYFKKRQEERINKIIEDREREQGYKKEREENSRQTKEYIRRENERRNIRKAIGLYEKDKWQHALMGVPCSDVILKHKWFKGFDPDILDEEGVY